MTKPVRLRRSRQKGSRLQAESEAVNGLPAIVVTRGTRWGNPHVAWRTLSHNGIPAWGWPPFEANNNAEADREGARIAVEAFRREAERAPPGTFEPLRGKNLACWCKPGAPCHADVLLDIANR